MNDRRWLLDRCNKLENEKADLKAKLAKARQETLREVRDILEVAAQHKVQPAEKLLNELLEAEREG